MKKKTSVTVDEINLKKLNELGISLTGLMNDAIEKAVKEKKCPVCKRKVRVK